MCDTVIAAPAATKNGRLLFGKNSDREPDEVQNLVYFPAQSHATNETVKCTYTEIPQAPATNAILLSQPFWMFGAEMGINEHGVVIGNEALMTRIEPGKGGLTGMDALRLALERSKTAAEARDAIIRLIEAYGQGGQCGYRHKLKYMNSFLIGDPKQAFVLEVVQKEWAWKEIADVWSISNQISLEKDYDARSENLVEVAIGKNWCKSEHDFNFRKCYSDKVITWGARAHRRQCDTRIRLQVKAGKLETPDIMATLRTHDGTRDWHPTKGLRMTVCAHATNKLTRATQTVNSMVVDNRVGDPLIFTTGASSPCVSPYFPIRMVPPHLPSGYRQGHENYAHESFWWRSEVLHRHLMEKYSNISSPITEDIQKLEAEMLNQAYPKEESPAKLSPVFIDKYFDSVVKFLAKWETQHLRWGTRFMDYGLRRYWERYNRLNQYPPAKNFRS